MKVIRHRLNLPPEYVISCLLERNTPNSVVIDNVQYSIKKSLRLVSLFGFWCHYCGAKVSRFDVANGIHSYHLPSLVPVTSNGTILNIDHIIPISKGGSRRAHENMVTSCESCNLRKQNIIPAGIEIEKVIIVKNILSMIKKDNITRERLKRVNAAIHRKADDVQCINEREVKKYIRSLTKKFCVEFENFDDSMYELIPKNYK